LFSVSQIDIVRAVD